MGNSSQNAKNTNIPVMDSNVIRITSSCGIYSHEAASMGLIRITISHRIGLTGEDNRSLPQWKKGLETKKPGTSAPYVDPKPILHSPLSPLLDTFILSANQGWIP